MKLSTPCSICQKPLQLVSECQFGEDWLRNYKCGHSFYETAIQTVSVPAWETHNRRNYASANGSGKAAFDYQKEGIDFCFRTNFNCLIADPMGLGKTIQALLAAREAKFPDGSPRFRKVLILVKSSTTYQWFGESKEWYSPALWSSYIIKGTKAFIPPGFQIYILSMDTLSRFARTPAGMQQIKNLDVDLVIVDECHSFKNPESARSQALVAFLQDISISELDRTLHLGCANCEHQWDKPIKIKINVRTNRGEMSHRESGECPVCGAKFAQITQHTLSLEDRTKGLILLSGTPIKNRADEYFIPLNLMRPDIFTSLDGFRKRWLTQNPETFKWNRIAPWRLDEFKKLTEDFIIRRDKSVLADLPPFRRTFEAILPDDPQFIKSYNSAIDTLQKRVDEEAEKGKELSTQEMMENLMILRRIVGLAKVPFALEYIEEFLESYDDEKIAIGIHHQSVRDNLYFALKQKGIKCLKLSGEDSPERKNQILMEFQSNPEIRVIIINMLAGGVGLNIQAANNILTLERQWNAADEEQFEGRFHRQGQKLPVLSNYLVAQEIPVEEQFNNWVENKRKYCGETLDGMDFTSDRAAIRDLVEKSLGSRLKG